MLQIYLLIKGSICKAQKNLIIFFNLILKIESNQLNNQSKCEPTNFAKSYFAAVNLLSTILAKHVALLLNKIYGML